MKKLIGKLFQEDVREYCIKQKDAIIQYFFDWLDLEVCDGSPLIELVPDPFCPWDHSGKLSQSGQVVTGDTTIETIMGSRTGAEIPTFSSGRGFDHPTYQEEFEEALDNILWSISYSVASKYCEQYKQEILAYTDLEEGEDLVGSFLEEFDHEFTGYDLWGLINIDEFLDSIPDMTLEEAREKCSGIGDIIAKNCNDYYKAVTGVKTKFCHMADSIALDRSPHLVLSNKDEYNRELALLKQTYSDFEIALLVWSRRITASNSVYSRLSKPVEDKINTEIQKLDREYSPRSLGFVPSGEPTIQDLTEDVIQEYNAAQEALRKEEDAKKAAAKAKKAARKEQIRQQQAEENEACAYLSQFNVAHMLSYAQTLSRKFVLHCGPTNSGKTYQALRSFTPAMTGCYLGPLRLLALEVFDTLNADGVPCSLLTGEEHIDTPYAGVTASTIEMTDFNKRYDVAVIDEAQLIADTARGGHWLSAILRINAAEVHICVAPEGLDLIRSLVTLTGSPYEVVQHERLTHLTYAGHFDTGGWKDAQRGDAFIAFSRKAVLNIAAELEFRGHKASVIYGALPPQSRREEVRRFVEGETEVIVATDAIGMGVSLPIRRVIFCETEKFDGQMRRPLNATEVKQIAGRAGRYGIYDEGFMLTMNDDKSMKKKLAAEPKPFTKAVIPFPKDVLSSKYPLALLVTLWNEFKPVEGFTYENLSEPAVLLGYLLRTMGVKRVEKFSKTTVFQYISCPLDTKNDVLVSYWLRCATALLQEQKMPLPTISTASLETCESSYRALDIASQMAHRAGVECDVSGQKRVVESAINKLLKQGKARRTCKYCGKPISPIGPYSMCEDCYNERCNRCADDWY